MRDIDSQQIPQKILERVTRYICIALDFVFIKNTEKSAYGVLTGIFLWIVTKIFSRPMSESWFSGILSLGIIEFAFVGLFVLYIPSIVMSVIRPSKLPYYIEEGFQVIEEMKRNGATDYQLQQANRILIETVLERYKLDENAIATIVRSAQQ